MEKVITFENAENGIEAIIAEATEMINNREKPEKPCKPLKPTTDNPSDYREYAQKLEDYVESRKAYDKSYDEYTGLREEIVSKLIWHIKDESGFFGIPKQYQQKVWEKCYRDNASESWGNIYNQLCEYVDIFG